MRYQTALCPEPFMLKVFLVFPTGEGKGIARTNETKGSQDAQFGTQFPEKFPKRVRVPFTVSRPLVSAGAGAAV